LAMPSICRSGKYSSLILSPLGGGSPCQRRPSFQC
jgi:hypothetical protein